ncbi:hypothetical protein [Xanthomonas sp. 3498]|uniref:hypothetical protein n=1 Tax=Xanthomonas sp. 3498 TaxID=2663863 RepID=UPI0016226ACC|nr:hypothetical protein [Xanthomonas sp. 3498]MBB5875862.1 hypothetical protein [Xanthomonas sp. 3498]
MLTIDEIRRIRLAQLVRQYGSQAALGRAVEKDKNQINQWLGRANARAMDSDNARAFEVACGKPKGWMDNLPTLDRVPALLEADAGLVTALEAHNDEMRAAYAELQRLLNEKPKSASRKRKAS